jgi:trehalose/maltose hydrolase-like predicted phosphorylase
MTILSFALKAQQLQVTTFDNSLQAEDTFTFPFEDFNLKATPSVLAQKILAQVPEVSGAVFQEIPETFYEKNPHTSQLNTSIESVVKVFSEQLNLPIIIYDDSLSVDQLTAHLAEKQHYDEWHLDYYGYTPGKEEYSIESLLTVGNGFMGLRGTLPEMQISPENYPATYIAGLYNEVQSTVAGQIVANEDFVNAPNNQYISVKTAADTHWLKIETAKLHKLHRNLDLKNGLFTSEMVVELDKDRLLKITSCKIVNMTQMNNYSLKYVIEPLNFSDTMQVKTTTDGAVYNFNVERYRNLTDKHLKVTNLQAAGKHTQIEATTNQSNIKVAQTAKIQGDFFDEQAIHNQVNEDTIEQIITFTAEKGHRYTLEKQVQVRSTLHEKSWHHPPSLAVSFAAAYQESAAAWVKLWAETDIQVANDFMSQKLLRLHIYHLLVSASPYNNPELDVSITARGLHGEAYRGHIFWDEIFILPFYIMHYPETAKQLLMYRYKRLAKAKENAKESHYEGAMFPWQSGQDGSEATQKLHLNPLNGEWGEDHSILQRHVSLAIAYNVWMYWNNTGDDAFMKTCGAELLLEIANFWRSAATYDATSGRYSIDKVMGPDEFHEAYPNSKNSGLKNNAYTNLMVVWLFEELAHVLDLLNESEKQVLFTKTGITSDVLATMKKIQNTLAIEINSEGIIAQYEGYFDLEEIDWTAAKAKYGNIYRMDRILKAAGESPDDYKVAKQADTLMLFYNLNKEQIDEILADLGYDLPTDYLEKNLLYYLNRTSHGSTLSRIVHAQLAEAVQFHDLSWRLYQEALHSDYQDIQGGTTAEGIHTGVMAATIYVTLTTYAGLDLKGKTLTVRPNLPEQWQKLQFHLKHRGIGYQFLLTAETVTVTSTQDTTIVIKDTPYQLKEQTASTIAL